MCSMCDTVTTFQWHEFYFDSFYITKHWISQGSFNWFASSFYPAAQGLTNGDGTQALQQAYSTIPYPGIGKSPYELTLFSFTCFECFELTPRFVLVGIFQTFFFFRVFHKHRVPTLFLSIWSSVFSSPKNQVPFEIIWSLFLFMSWCFNFIPMFPVAFSFFPAFTWCLILNLAVHELWCGESFILQFIVNGLANQQLQPSFLRTN